MDKTPQDLEPTKRFSDRVAYYKQYRPGYPREIISYLETEIGLSTESIVADVGSGTGLLARLFLAYGNTVYAVEPNEKMRAVAEEELRRYQGFQSVHGTAENTTLEEASIDLITAGQAFHWFRIEEARQELWRILRAEGRVALVYNSWNVSVLILRASTGPSQSCTIG